MVRTQIQLESAQARRLKRYARRAGISMAEAIRRGVELLLEDEGAELDERYERAAGLAGAFDDPEGRTDLSAGHDDLLGEAFD